MSEVLSTETEIAPARDVLFDPGGRLFPPGRNELPPHRHREHPTITRYDHLNGIGRADVVLRPNVARRLREAVEPVKLFPCVFLSEAAAHAAGVGGAVRRGQRLIREPWLAQPGPA